MLKVHRNAAFAVGVRSTIIHTPMNLIKHSTFALTMALVVVLPMTLKARESLIPHLPQGHGFINNSLTKKGHTYLIYLPPDANTLVGTVRHCVGSTGYIIRQLLLERPDNERFDVNGYREEGTTTTPFDMQVRNKTSRWHLVILTAQKLAAGNPQMAALAEELIRKYEHKLRDHHDYVRATSIDPPEILNWRWQAQRPNS